MTLAQEIEQIIKKELPCTCMDGHGIVCVGCFYCKSLAQAIVNSLCVDEDVITREINKYNGLNTYKIFVKDFAKALSTSKDLIKVRSK